MGNSKAGERPEENGTQLVRENDKILGVYFVFEHYCMDICNGASIALASMWADNLLWEKLTDQLPMFETDNAPYYRGWFWMKNKSAKNKDWHPIEIVEENSILYVNHRVLGKILLDAFCCEFDVLWSNRSIHHVIDEYKPEVSICQN